MKKIYSVLGNLKSIPKYNWCSFALSYLTHQIKKFKTNLLHNKTYLPGGCKLILVDSNKHQTKVTSLVNKPIQIIHCSRYYAR